MRTFFYCLQFNETDDFPLIKAINQYLTAENLAMFQLVVSFTP